jgi:hypothetical protein
MFSIVMILKQWKFTLESNKSIKFNTGKIILLFNLYFSVPNNERINVAHLELAMRLPMEYIPDPRTVIEDAQDKEKEERDAAERRKRE